MTEMLRAHGPEILRWLGVAVLFLALVVRIMFRIWPRLAHSDEFYARVSVRAGGPPIQGLATPSNMLMIAGILTYLMSFVLEHMIAHPERWQ